MKNTPDRTQLVMNTHFAKCRSSAVNRVLFLFYKRDLGQRVCCTLPINAIVRIALCLLKERAGYSSAVLLDMRILCFVIVAFRDTQTSVVFFSIAHTSFYLGKVRLFSLVLLA